jgi:nucleotide-binding universal stress UspA family protein
MIKCLVCGSHVPKEVAVELMLEGKPQDFCSVGCADTALAEGVALAPPPSPPVPRRILVAVDGSGPSLRAVATAAALAALGHGDVCLLYAVESSGPGVEDAHAQLGYCRRLCEKAGVPTTTRVVFKPPSDAILEAANDAELVVMGSRGRGALAALVLGSVSHRVLEGTRTPVLVVY